MKESRIQKSFQNARVNIICYFVSLIVAFFTRKILLDRLGADFIGLTGTLSSLLGFLNLAELGIGTAIGYVLYKPLLDSDQNKINEIISVFGYLYRCIGLFILGIGVVVSLFLPKIFPNTPFSMGVIYIGFYVYLAYSLLTYFVNYKMTLLSADQRNYVVTGYYQIVYTAKVLVQMSLAIYLANFYLYFVIEITFAIIYSIILSWRVRKTYPWLRSEVREGRRLFRKYPEIWKYIKQLFVHKIGSFVQFQITPFLIYSYVSLPVVALYGNYTLISQKIQSLATTVLDSTAAGVGNLIAEEGRSDKAYNIYRELFSVRILAAGVIGLCFFRLCTPFIAIWLGPEYQLTRLVALLISVQLFLAALRGVTDQFLFAHGLFYDIWAPLVEAGIFILSSIAGGMLWGLPGVLCGPLLSTILIVYIWKPYFLYSKGFHRPIRQFYWMFFVHAIPIAAAFATTEWLCSLILDMSVLGSSWGSWVAGAVLYTALLSILSSLFLYAVSPGLRGFTKTIVQKIKSKPDRNDD